PQGLKPGLEPLGGDCNKAPGECTPEPGEAGAPEPGEAGAHEPGEAGAHEPGEAGSNPHFFSFRRSASSRRLSRLAASATSPPASPRALLILSRSFQSWITRYSVRSPMPSIRAASSRLPLVSCSAWSM